MARLLRKSILVKCNWCKKRITRTPSTRNKKNFCGYECAGKHLSLYGTGSNARHWQGGIVHTDRILARNRLNKAIRSGKVKRLGCCVCGDVKSEGHHYMGYEEKNWYEIIWVCRRHHREIEGKTAEKARDKVKELLSTLPKE